MRVLVAIAHHGQKNRHHLCRMLDEFQTMPHDVHVAVLSETEKPWLNEHVETVLGTPTDNPWSLPFAHRELFASRLEDFDLFVYSEDDTLITSRHIKAFLALSESLPDGYLPGFMRYEIDPAGNRSYCTVHSHYRWLPESVFRCDGLTFATFSNDHAACYMMTQKHLRTAVSSGGFLVEPYEGRYDMLVSAATDPYTQCGFKKVLCVEQIEDLLVHHLPNVYLEKFGIGQQAFDVQIRQLQLLADRRDDIESYLVPEVRTSDAYWDKHLFARIDAKRVSRRLGENGRLLALGVGDGKLERQLLDEGWDVEVVPIDPVLAEVAASRGLATWPARRLSEATPSGDPRFDVVLAIDVLQFLPDPIAEIAAARRMLRPDGRFIATVPDHPRYRVRNRLRRTSTPEIPTSFAANGMHPTSRVTVRRWLEKAGLTQVSTEHRRASRSDPFGSGRWQDRPFANSWLAVGSVRR
jgi:SAM-dependent methyltransferase